MVKGVSAAEFHRDPVGYLDRAFPAAGDAFWLPGRQLCLAEPAAARAVLINGDGQGAGPEAPAPELAEVFLSFLFSIGGSVGFVLGWSVWLLGTNPRTEAPPASVILEALRLWPVAWMLGRQPARPHQVAGVEVTPRDLVVVCPYLVHRHPRYWDDPASFRPERWADSPVLKILLDGHELTVETRDNRPCAGPALAPPRFALGLHPQRP